jgi:hypothetical protein
MLCSSVASCSTNTLARSSTPVAAAGDQSSRSDVGAGMSTIDVAAGCGCDDGCTDSGCAVEEATQVQDRDDSHAL